MTDKEISEFLNEISIEYTVVEQPYNPMAEFVEYVSTKEIVHTKILYELLCPNGAHGFDDLPLKNFIKRFIPEVSIGNNTQVSVYKEYKVERIHTIGDDRSIDIVISIDNHNEKIAVAIENKLNDAGFQPSQLEDYHDSLLKEFDKVIIVVTPMIWRNEYLNCSANVILLPIQLGEWLLESCITSPNIVAYANFLKQINANNQHMNNANKLLTLDIDEIKKIAIISQAYSNFPNSIIESFSESLKSEYGDDLSIQPGNYKKSLEWSPCIQIWLKSKSEVWIELFYDTPDKDAQSKLYIVYNDTDESAGSQVVNKLVNMVVKNNTTNKRTWYRLNTDKTIGFYNRDSREESLRQIRMILDAIKGL